MSSAAIRPARRSSRIAGRLAFLARSTATLAQSLAGIVAALLIWRYAAQGLGNEVLLPRPSEVLAVFGEELTSSRFYLDIGASLRRVFGGYAGAAALATPLALAMASWRPLRRAVMPVVTVLRPIPPIAWIPLAILWFGLGDKPSFFITAVAAFFPIFLNAFDGANCVERRHIEAARALGASPWALLAEVRLPAALPMIATGLRVGLGQSWMAVVTAELIAAQNGLGYMIQANRLALQTTHVLVGMIAIGLLGALMTTSFACIEAKWLVPWKEK